MQDQQEPTIEQLEAQITRKNSNSQDAQQVSPEPRGSLVSWSASEFIAHHKSLSWYVSFGIGLALLSVLVYLLTRDAISLIVVLIAGASFGVLATRKPEVRQYEITPSGIDVSGRLYEFDSFKSFAVHDEGAISSIFLLPIKRFTTELRVYYPPDQEDQIIEAISDYLPMEDSDPDAIDNLMRKIRF